MSARCLGVALVLLSTLACTEGGDGALRLEVSFAPDALPAPAGVSFVAKTRLEWPGGQSESSAPFEPGTPLALDGFPLGADRLVILELSAPGLGVLYHGRSAPFSLAAGDSRSVSIELGSAPAAVAPGSNTEGVLRIDEETAQRSVPDPSITLRLAVLRGGTLVRGAANPALTLGLREAPYQSLVDADGAGLTWTEWDLDTGACQSPPCPDGRREVYLQIVDADGYGSPVYSVATTLDTTPPAIVESTAGVLLIPSDDNPLTEVNAAGRGTRVRLSFSFDEAIAGEPAVASTAAVPLAFTLVGGGGSSFVYEVIVDDDTGGLDGRHEVRVDALDLAGKRHNATVDALGFDVDTTPPPAPLVDRAGAVVYHRVPWGSQTVGPAGRFFVEATQDAVPEAQRLLIFDDALERRIGEAPVVEGTTRVIIDPLDRAVVRIVAADAAGNLSESRRVRDARWVATLGGKLPGRVQENPHDAVWTHRMVPSRDQHPDSQIGPSALQFATLAQIDGATLEVDGRGLWRRRAPSAPPSERGGVEICYDTQRGRATLFSGFQGDRNAVPDLWEFIDDAWFEVTPARSGPRARSGATCAYHAASGLTLIHGGTTAFNELLDDFWGWDGARWIPLPSGPPPRHDAAMAYDAGRGRTLLFGGIVGREFMGDTWEWDGSSWREISMPGPPPRSNAVMVYDSTRGELLLHGGSDADTFFDDLWRFDGNGWSEITPPAPRPVGRSSHQAAFDASRARMVIFGGVDATLRHRRDLWEWDGSRWHELPQGDLRPRQRSGGGLVYLPERRESLLFGGSNTQQRLRDLWTWDGARWLPFIQSDEQPRLAPNMSGAYDRINRGLLMLGSNDQRDGARDAETWLWRGAGWSLMPPTPGFPELRFAGVAQDPHSAGVLIFGGVVADTDFTGNETTWVWNGSSWNEIGDFPVPLRTRGAVTDTARRRVVVVTEGNHTGVWERDEDTWVSHAAGPELPRRNGHVVAYDAWRGHTLVFSGAEIGEPELNDLWAWDGEHWREIDDGPPPPARHSGAMGYDQARGRALLFGGIVPRSVLGDFWEWNGESWRELNPVGPQPEPRSDALMVYDPDRNVTVLAGGGSLTGGNLTQFTWEWRSELALAPALVSRFDWRSAGAEDAELLEVSVRADAGASGNTRILPGPGERQAGVTLQAWDAITGAWRELTTGSAGPEAPERLSWTSANAAEAARFIAADATVTAALRPVAGQGTGVDPALVTTDYLELEVRYRRD